MKMVSASDTIRQAQAGRFRGPDDGRNPYAHVNDSRLKSAKDQKSRSIFVNSQKTITFKKEVSESAFPRLFDHDAGMQFVLDKIAESKTGDHSFGQYDSAGKKKEQSKQYPSIVDEWA
jgi:hypothetical protein